MGELNRRKKNVECSGDNIKGEVEKWMLFVGTLHTTFTEHSMVRKSIKLWCLTIYRVNSEASQAEIAPNSNNCCDQRAERERELGEYDGRCAADILLETLLNKTQHSETWFWHFQL